jgi:hypothetical protein
MRKMPLSKNGFLGLLLSLGIAAGCGSAPAAQPSDEALSHPERFRLAECPKQTPDPLAPPAEERLKIGLSATGVQIYTCTNIANSYAWTFKAPEADLFFGPFPVGRHFAGPSWELFDGTTVVTKKIAAATVDPTAIPWLLTQTVSTSGDGLLSDVQYVQRLSTTGGLMPVTGCASAADVGKEARVPYTANYFFYDSSEHNQNLGCR